MSPTGLPLKVVRMAAVSLPRTYINRIDKSLTTVVAGSGGVITSAVDMVNIMFSGTELLLTPSSRLLGFKLCY